MENYYLLTVSITLSILLVFYCLKKIFNVNIIKDKFTTKQLTGAGVLSAVEVVMIAISNYITIGPVNMNLSLVPIAVGAMLYGPIVGGFLGFINGVVTILSPSTMAVFMPISPIGTILVCLLKTTIAGLVSGLLFKAYRNKSMLSALTSSIVVPFINTGLFVVGCYLFFQSWLNVGAVGYDNSFMFLLFAVMGWNFLIEVVISTVLSPSVYSIVRYFSRNRE